jgi:hypothetical protein
LFVDTLELALLDETADLLEASLAADRGVHAGGVKVLQNCAISSASILSVLFRNPMALE